MPITSRRIWPVLAVVLSSSLLLACGLVGGAAALAAGPATVTVRVVGSKNYESLLPLTEVTTTTTPVTKDGGSCSGTSAAGALELATKGDWEGNWSSKYSDYEVISIEDKSFPFEEGSPANYYWSFWVNDKYQEVGVCEAELEPGSRVLFVPSCYGKSCPPSPSLLAIEVPAAVEVNKPVTVTVLSYPTEGGEPKPAVGARVIGGGDATAPPTNEQGQTTMFFGDDGKYTLSATGDPEGSPSIPAEAFVCAHEGDDGECGTPAPPSTPVIQPPPSGGSAPPVGPEVAEIAGVKEGHVYARRGAPRVLKGTVTVPAGELLRKVQISLKRRSGGRCFDFSGSRERFVAIGCKRSAAFFSVGAKDSFSYLLPARLPRGQYTYEIEAVNGAGQVTTPLAGVSRVVFGVK
jgi:hypothetical protein